MPSYEVSIILPKIWLSGENLFRAGEMQNFADIFERDIFFDRNFPDTSRQEKMQRTFAFFLVRHHGFQDRGRFEIEFLDRNRQPYGNEKLHLAPGKFLRA